MSVLQSVVEYLDTVNNDPYRSGVLKSKEIIEHSEATRHNIRYVIGQITQGEIDGVEVTKVSSGYPARYRIESINRIPKKAVLTTPEMCRTIRKQLKNGKNTYEVAETMGIDYNTVNTHGRGQCSHDITEPPAKPVRDGNNRYWVEA